MFDSKGDVYRTLKSLRDIHDYAGDSLINPDTAFISQSLKIFYIFLKTLFLSKKFAFILINF